MYTGVYWPADYPAFERRDMNFSGLWREGDFSSVSNHAAYVESPSYCVRLWVFDYDYEG